MGFAKCDGEKGKTFPGPSEKISRLTRLELWEPGVTAWELNNVVTTPGTGLCSLYRQNVPHYFRAR